MFHETKTCVRTGEPRVAAPVGDALNPTVFHEPWWLDVTTEGRWKESTVESGGRLMGRLPYLPDRKFTGQLSLVMPRLTRCLGPAVVATGEPDDCVRLPSRHKITRELIAGLPKCSHIWMQMHGGIHDVMMFEAAGCDVTVRHTTEIATAPPDVIWAGMRDKTRNVIRRAQETLAIDVGTSGHEFIAFYAECSKAQGRRNDYPSSICGEIVSQILNRERGRAYYAVDPKGEPIAAILTVSDARASYYLMSARRPDAGNGAVSLLLWAAIQDAVAAGRAFDGDGLSLENHMLLTGLGGRIRPRYLVSRTAPLMAMGRCAKEMAVRTRRAMANAVVAHRR